jgi:beta-galactosidase
MRTTIYGFFAIVAIGLSPVWPVTVGARERICIDDGWRFIKGDPANCPVNLVYDLGEDQAPSSTNRPTIVLKPWVLPSGNEFISDPRDSFKRPGGNPWENVAYVQPGFNDSLWQSINLPHDWAISGPFSPVGGGGMGRLPTAGIGWYRKNLDIPAADSGKRIFLDVDGAMSYAAVWLNGQLVGGSPYGYASWRLDLTPFVNFGGNNTLAIRLNNLPDSSRWYPGAGIYRNVWLLKTQPVHVRHWGTFLTTPDISPERAGVNLKVTVDNDSETNATVTVASLIFRLDDEGRKTGRPVATIATVNVQIGPRNHALAEGHTTVLKPKLWGPPPAQKPNLYVAVTRLSVNGKIVDEYETQFGIRKIECKPDGLFVNGRRVRIQGVNLHDDFGALGTAFNIRAAERQVQELRDMGCNAIRTSHNPPAPEFLELADRMGFLVMDEIFDCWYRQKTPFDFHLIFPDWRQQDLRAFISRDQNHPSVFLWSVGNEVGEQFTGPGGAKVARELVGIAHDADPSRLATASMNVAKAGSPFADAMDVISLNYQGEGIRDSPQFETQQGIRTPPQYAIFHEKYPDKMILSSETAAAFSSRGVYLFPVSKDTSSMTADHMGGDSKAREVSSYGLYAAFFGSSPDKVFAAQDSHPYVAGQFVWSGWDYLGEPSPYDASRSSYYGILDLAGFRKDFPMAHILPHWTWPERVGQVTPVHVFTSGDEAELFLNGKSLGRKKKGPSDYRLRWDDVPYQPGTLKAIAWKNGKKWATDIVKTAGAAAKLDLKPDRSAIAADGRDLSFVTVSVTDKHGVSVPRADSLIHFEISGSGEIVATENGDPTSFHSFQSHDCKVFNGLCLVIVRGKAGRPGTIKLRADSDSIEGGTVILKSISPGAKNMTFETN